MDLLNGNTIYKSDGTSVNPDDALANKKLVGFYFSAHWCPPCRGFTPVLKKFYEEASKNDDIEIIFISSDESEDDMANYMKESHGQWLYVKLNSDLSKALEEKFQVEGIPKFVVVRKSDGEVVTLEGRRVVEAKGKDAVKEWL